jgi:hypothetical protein
MDYADVRKMQIAAAVAVPRPSRVQARNLRAQRCMYTRRATAPVAQRIEHLTTDQKVRGSNPFGRAISRVPPTSEDTASGPFRNVSSVDR